MPLSMAPLAHSPAPDSRSTPFTPPVVRLSSASGSSTSATLSSTATTSPPVSTAMATATTTTNGPSTATIANTNRGSLVHSTATAAASGATHLDSLPPASSPATEDPPQCGHDDRPTPRALDETTTAAPTLPHDDECSRQFPLHPRSSLDPPVATATATPTPASAPPVPTTSSSLSSSLTSSSSLSPSGTGAGAGAPTPSQVHSLSSPPSTPSSPRVAASSSPPATLAASRSNHGPSASKPYSSPQPQASLSQTPALHGGAPPMGFPPGPLPPLPSLAQPGPQGYGPPTPYYGPTPPHGHRRPIPPYASNQAMAPPGPGPHPPPSSTGGASNVGGASTSGGTGGTRAGQAAYPHGPPPPPPPPSYKPAYMVGQGYGMNEYHHGPPPPHHQHHHHTVHHHQGTGYYGAPEPWGGGPGPGGGAGNSGGSGGSGGGGRGHHGHHGQGGYASTTATLQKKPKELDKAMWVGNVSSDTTVAELEVIFGTAPTDTEGDIQHDPFESIFILAKSNCAFVNYASHDAVDRAVKRFHDREFKNTRLVCRPRKDPVTSILPGPGPVDQYPVKGHGHPGASGPVSSGGGGGRYPQHPKHPHGPHHHHAQQQQHHHGHPHGQQHPQSHPPFHHGATGAGHYPPDPGAGIGMGMGPPIGMGMGMGIGMGLGMGGYYGADPGFMGPPLPHPPSHPHGHPSHGPPPQMRSHISGSGQGGMPSVSGSLDDPQMLSEAHRRMERMRMEDAVSPMMDSASSGGEGAGSLSGAPTGGSSGPRRRKDGGLGGSKKSRGRASPAALSTSTNASTHAASTSYCENRYFILKSLNEEDLKLSVQFGIWATQSHLVPILNDAFEHSKNVYLIFSANKSGEFFGYAKMADSISQEKEQAIEHAREGQTWEPSIEFPISPELRAAALEEIEQAAKEGHLTFNEAEIIGRASTTTKSWGIEFLIEWIEVHKVPFTKTSHLLNPLYEDREVKVSKDGTEVDPAVGEQLVALFKKPGNRDRSRKAGRSQLAEGSTSSSSTTGCTGDDAATTISVSNSEAGEQEGDGEGHPSRRPSLAAVHSAASSANVEQTATSDRASPQPPHQLNQSLMPSRGLSSRRSSVLSAKSTSSGSGMAAERRPSTDPGSIKQGASGGGSGAKYGHQQHQSKGYHGAGGSNGGDGYRSGPRHQSYHSPSGSSSSTGPAYGQEGIAGQQPSYGDQHRPGWYKSNYRGNSGTPMMAAGSPIPGQGSPSVGGGSGDYYQPSQHRKGGGGGKYGPSSSSSGMGYDSSSQFQQQHNLRRNYGAHPHGNHHMGGNVGGNYRSGGNGPSHSQTTTPSVPSGSGPVTAADSLQSGSSTNRGSSQEHRFGNSGGNYGSKSGPLSTSALSTSNTGTTTSQSPTGSSGAGAAALTPQQQHSSMYGQAPPPGVAYTFMPQHAAAAAHAAAMQGYHQVMSPYMTYPYMPGPNPYLHGMGWVPTAGATAGQGPPPPMGGMMAGHPPPIPHHGQHGFQPQQHGFQQHGFQIPYPPGAHPHPQPGPYQLGVSNAGGNLPVLASGAGIESAGTTATGVGAGVSSQGAAGGQEMMMMTMMPMGGMVPLFGYDGIPYAYISAEEAYHQSMQAYGYGYMQPMEETAPDVEGDGEADYGEGQVQLEDEGAAEGDYMPQGDKHLEIDHGHELEGDLMESEIRSIQDQQHSADHSHLLLQRQQLNNSSLASSTLSSSSTLIPPGLSSVGKVHESAMDEYDDDENRWEEDLAAKGVVPQEYRSPVLRKESEVEGSAQPGAVSGGNDVEGKERQKQQQQQQVLQQQQQKSRPGSRHQQRQKQHQQKRASLSRTRNGPGEDEDESPRGEMGGSGMATTLTTPTAVAS